MIGAQDTSDHRVATERAQDIARRVHRVPEAPSEGPRYIGLVTRAVAFVIDAALVNAVAAIVGAAAALVLSIFPVSHDVHTAIVALGGALFFIWVIAYFVTFWSTTGQTPGNRLMQIRVVRSGGGRLKPRHALLRAGGIVLAALPLFAGFVPVLLTERRRGLADWLADTVVIAADLKATGTETR